MSRHSRSSKAAKQAAAKVFPKAAKFLRPLGVPDLSAREQWDQVRLPPGLRVEELVTPGEEAARVVHVPFQAAPAEALTGEQRAIQLAGETLARLMGDRAVKDVIESLIAFRQAYVVAYRELMERAEAAQQAAEGRGEMFSPQVVDFAVQYAVYEAGKPFDEHALMRRVIGHTLPWLTAVIDRHTQDEENARVADRQARDADRRTRAVPVGFPLVPDGDPALPRDRSAVLVGWAPAVRYVLDRAEAAARAGGASAVVRFGTGRAAAADQHHDLARVSEADWRGCANTRQGVAEVMGTFVADQLTRQPDLVIVDHLPAASTGLVLAKPPGAAAGDAHRRFRAWCDQAGAALLAGVMLPDPAAPPLDGPEWEQLKTFSAVRPLAVEVAGAGGPDARYVISVGSRAVTFEVPCAVLDNIAGDLVVPPGGGG